MKSTFKTTAIATVVALAALTGSSAFAQNAQTHLFSEADVCQFFAENHASRERSK